MSVAFVFPGQGSQYIGMGKDLVTGNAQAKILFEKADDLLGFQISKICFDGPDEEFKTNKKYTTGNFSAQCGCIHANA